MSTDPHVSVTDPHAMTTDPHAPFPLTDLQQAHWAGRDPAFPLGGVSARTYAEWEGDADVDRLIAAWRLLATRHDALRLVVDPDRDTQRVLPEPGPFPVALHDLRALPSGAADHRLEEIRAGIAHRDADPRRWPLVDVAVSRLDDDRLRLHVGFDQLVLDFQSWQRLLDELAVAYAGDPLPAPPATSFRDHVLATRAAVGDDEHRRALEHWRDRIPELPPAPALPLAVDGDVPGPRALVPHRLRIDGDRWRAVALAGRSAGVRLMPGALAIALVAETLASAARGERFLLGVPVGVRPGTDPRIGEVLGVFSTFLPIAVERTPGSPFAVTAPALARRLGSDLAHHHTGGVRILRELARDRDAAEEALLPVLVTVLPTGTDGGLLGGDLRPTAEAVQGPQVALDVRIRIDRGATDVDLAAREGLLAPGLVEALAEHFDALVAALADPDAWLDASRLPSPRAAWAGPADASVPPPAVDPDAWVPPAGPLQRVLVALWTDEVPAERAGRWDVPARAARRPGAAGRVRARLRDELAAPDPWPGDPGRWEDATIAATAAALRTVDDPARLDRAAELWLRVAAMDDAALGVGSPDLRRGD